MPENVPDTVALPPVTLTAPPLFEALFLEKVAPVTVKVPDETETAPPFEEAVLSENVGFVRIAVPPETRRPPPFSILHFVKVQPVNAAVPPETATPPPLPEPSNVISWNVTDDDPPAVKCRSS